MPEPKSEPVKTDSELIEEFTSDAKTVLSKSDLTSVVRIGKARAEIMKLHAATVDKLSDPNAAIALNAKFAQIGVIVSIYELGAKQAIKIL